MNNYPDSIDKLKELNFEDCSTTSGLDLGFKNKFKKDFIHLGIDNEKLRFASILGLQVSSSSENFATVSYYQAM